MEIVKADRQRAGMEKGLPCRVQKEFYRKKFVKQAKKQKRRCFSAAFKGKQTRKSASCKLVVGRICSFCVWFCLGVFVLVVSWELFWRTGEWMFLTRPFPAKEEEIRAGQEEEPGINQQEEGWSREFFGVEIRIHDGKIVFFQEKNEKTPLP